MTKPNLNYTLSPQSFNFPMQKPAVAASSPQVSYPFLISLDHNSSIPSSLPQNIYVEKNELTEGGWINYLKRCFIPNFATNQDRKITDFFIGYFKKIINSEATPLERQKLTGMISLADQHSARVQGSSRLEHYSLAARNLFNLFDALHVKNTLTNRCRSNNESLLNRWNKLGYSEEAFWKCPDLVDFIFKAHLHHHISHPDFNHSIQMKSCVVLRDGKHTVVQEPHLLMNGTQTPWSEIRQRIKLDREGRLYSEEKGQKKYWMYLEEGFTKWDKYNYDIPRRFRKIDQVPLRSRVELITTQARKKDWAFTDRVLKGTRHTFIRIIPGQDFLARNPNAVVKEGELYSFGWGARWSSFSAWLPFATLQGQHFCPDNWEFLNKEDFHITPIEIDDEQKIVKLLDLIQEHNQGDRSFNVTTANCSGEVADILEQADILKLETKNHLGYLFYKLLVPKCIRTPINMFSRLIHQVTPGFISKSVEAIAGFAFSVIFAPIFSILGAWKTNVVNDEGDTSERNMRKVAAGKNIKPHFTSVFDMFNPEKMKFDLTLNVYKWQKRQPSTIHEIRE